MKKVFPLLLIPGMLAANEVYFSPKGHVRDEIIQRITHAQASIDIAMYSLTSHEIAASLAKAQRRGVKVRIIRDVSQTSDRGDQDGFLGQTGIELRLLRGLGRGIMHDKFAIFDGKEGFTGSYNWMQNAELDNYENAFFFTDAPILAAYEREFAQLWELAQPLGAHAQTNSHVPGVLHDHPALSVFGLFVILLAVAAALAT